MEALRQRGTGLLLAPPEVGIGAVAAHEVPLGRGDVGQDPGEELCTTGEMGDSLDRGHG